MLGPHNSPLWLHKVITRASQVFYTWQPSAQTAQMKHPKDLAACPRLDNRVSKAQMHQTKKRAGGKERGRVNVALVRPEQLMEEHDPASLA